ncbi:MAG: glycerol kinase [Rhodobacterales bacterium RIFCSPHIGHO2_02_FULL_62_130]|nr:MAG: glycerol kinase [Rhodobacterales bacterium RIFCSPHIGHO2_02_FULL_62_130]OHC54205.1 MAG: glycerol kinase [Rhodobacterales bacterium RIFCSPHIGHO2_12_FULL_62_75]HCY99742.1 glycerol kinase [Rhodobacter sp.]
MRILALDQGTTSTRLMAADASGLHGLGQLRHRTCFPSAGWVEQDPTEILTNCKTLLAQAGVADAIALANQGESCLGWDALTKEPLSPIIVWQDRRTTAQLALMSNQADEVASLSGLPLDPYFSAAKLGWLLRENPAIAAAHAAGRLRLGTTDAFLLDALAGCFATDRATASRTGLMNLASGNWDARLCEVFGVPMTCLPEIRGNLAGFGQIGGIPVAAAIVDQQAALYGHGCRNRGDAKITFGTGAFALAVTGATPPLPQGGLLPTVAWDLGAGMVYALDGGVQDAGSAIEWALRAGLADNVAAFDSFDRPPAVARDLVFLPAFSGLGAPQWDRTAAPLMIGLGPDMTRRDICQALVEGIAFQTAALIDELARAVPLSAPIAIDGGLSASRYFTSFLAQACQRDIVVAAVAECTAFGAAQLAALALGTSLPAPVGAAKAIAAGPPMPDWHARFATALARSCGWRVN